MQTSKIARFFLFFLAIVAVLPFFVLALYAQPSSRDEFNYALHESKNLYDFFVYYYFNTSGRYSLIPLMYVFNPMRFEFPYFVFFLRFFSVFYLLLLFSSFYFLFVQVGKEASKQTSVFCMTLVFYIIFLNSIGGIEEYVYWFVGATAYLIPTVFYVFFLAFFVKCTKNQTAKRIDYILMYVFLVLSMGANELLNVFHCFLFGWFWLHSVWSKSAQTKLLTLILGVSVLCSLFLFLAPGNFARLSTLDKMLYDDTHIRYAYKPLWKITLLAMYLALGNLGNWLSNAFLWLFVLTIFPCMIALDKQYAWSKKRLLHPFLFSLALFFVFSVFHIFILRANHYGISRVMAFLWILFVIGFLVNMQIWVCYLCRLGFWEDNHFKIPFQQQILTYIQIAILALSIIPANYNINNAYYEIFLVVPKFDAFNQERFETLAKASKQGKQNVVLPKTPPALRSKFLIVEDFGDAQEPYNKAVARYFGLASIEVR
ncbi:MAG: hypothetical protein EAZ95_12555 [Bacteroidetes bacterium]|nr:MAG: hypothetical protein EAZ95_12555 [Bacteroidota bacterium]